MNELTHDARESSQGCCTCTCEGPVYCCLKAHKLEQSGMHTGNNKSCPWYALDLRRRM
jgi:hypothetical protein